VSQGWLLKLDDVRRIKELEVENSLLRKTVPVSPSTD
jgi:hypothetical protein